MNGKCFDIGVLQTFVDGELGSSKSEELVRHLSVCDDCTVLVAELESENDLAFSAMDQELNVLVPTERLRTKVFASINEIESGKSAGFWASVSAALGLNGLAARPGIAAFAAVLMFVAFAAIGLKVFSPVEPVQVAVNPTEEDTVEIVDPPADLPTSTANENIDIDPPSRTGDTVIPNPSSPTSVQAPVRAMRASYRETPRRTRRTPRRAVSTTAASPPAPSPNLAAEDSYLRTIATLSRTVDENKDFVLRPKERVSFERDLAVVNDAIKKMKGEVRKNPRNTAAREVLRSSYKSKIDLLNSVAERADTVATLD